MGHDRGREGEEDRGSIPIAHPNPPLLIIAPDMTFESDLMVPPTPGYTAGKQVHCARTPAVGYTAESAVQDQCGGSATSPLQDTRRPPAPAMRHVPFANLRSRQRGFCPEKITLPRVTPSVSFRLDPWA